MTSSLDNRVIAFVEARMSGQLGSLITRHGGIPYPAPVLQEVYLKNSPDVQKLVSDMCSGYIDAIVLQTGVGTTALIETAESMGLKEAFLHALDDSTVISRSPKPASVLRKYKIHIDIMPPEPYTSSDLIVAINDLSFPGKRVAIQQYGAPNSLLSQNLSDLGADVTEVALYSWGLPEDETPVMNMINDIDKGDISAIAFTSQPQVPNLLEIAERNHQKESLLKNLCGPLVVGSVGPVCSKRLEGYGIKVDVEPEHPHMGSLVVALSEHFNR